MNIRNIFKTIKAFQEVSAKNSKRRV